MHNKFKALGEKPYALSFAKRRSLFIVSEALERSICIAEVYSPLSIAYFNLSNIITKEC